MVAHNNIFMLQMFHCSRRCSCKWRKCSQTIVYVYICLTFVFHFFVFTSALIMLTSSHQNVCVCEREKGRKCKTENHNVESSSSSFAINSFYSHSTHIYRLDPWCSNFFEIIGIEFSTKHDKSIFIYITDIEESSGLDLCLGVGLKPWEYICILMYVTFQGCSLELCFQTSRAQSAVPYNPCSIFTICNTLQPESASHVLRMPLNRQDSRGAPTIPHYMRVCTHFARDLCINQCNNNMLLLLPYCKGICTKELCVPIMKCCWQGKQTNRSQESV